MNNNEVDIGKRTGNGGVVRIQFWKTDKHSEKFFQSQTNKSDTPLRRYLKCKMIASSYPYSNEFGYAFNNRNIICILHY